MRTAKYYLQNAAGNRYSLNVPGNVFLKNISGLGVNFNDAYSSMDNGFFQRTSKAIMQGKIVFDIVIFSDAMNVYKELVDWIVSSKDLFFVYNPAGTQDYYRRVNVGYLTKTYRDNSGVLVVPCSLTCLTPWYTLNNVQIELTKQTENALRFPFVFDENLYFGSSNIGNYAADITGTGHIPDVLRIAYTGAATHPTISLMNGSEEIGKCVCDVVMVDGDVLELSTEYSNSYVRLTHNGTVTDLIDSNAVDITHDPFFRVPVGDTCTIQIQAESQLEGTASCKILSYYRSV